MDCQYEYKFPLRWYDNVWLSNLHNRNVYTNKDMCQLNIITILKCYIILYIIFYDEYNRLTLTFTETGPNTGPFFNHINIVLKRHLQPSVSQCNDAYSGRNGQQFYSIVKELFLIARFMRPTWGPSGADRTQVGPYWPHELAIWDGLLGTKCTSQAPNTTWHVTQHASKRHKTLVENKVA